MSPPPQRSPIRRCNRVDQHAAHAWRASDFGVGDSILSWCDGLNADGTSPYDPMRPGYEAPPVEADPILLLLAHAASVGGHVTIHANYSPSSSRKPEPDWSAQVLWIASPTEGAPQEPYSVYGSGANLHEACSAALTQLDPTGGA